MVCLESEGERAADFGGVIPTPEPLPLNYMTASDLYPRDTLNAKGRWPDEAEQGNRLPAFEHGAEPRAGRLTRRPEGRRELMPAAIEGPDGSKP